MTLVSKSHQTRRALYRLLLPWEMNVTTKPLGFDGFMHWNEGRGSEPCRRLSFLLLFDTQGRPQGWLCLLVIVWAVVAAMALGAAA